MLDGYVIFLSWAPSFDMNPVFHLHELRLLKPSDQMPAFAVRQSKLFRDILTAMLVLKIC